MRTGWEKAWLVAGALSLMAGAGAAARADPAPGDAACLPATMAGASFGSATPETVTLETVTLVAVTPEGDLALGDGRVLRLAWVLTGAAGADPLRLAAHVAAWRGRPLRLVAAGTAPDRWGRLIGDLVDPGAAEGPRHLGLALLRAGDGLVQPGHPDMACRAALATAELEARRQGLGLWAAAARIKALKAADGAAVMALLGQHMVMEGRIVSISERTSVVYLNFARRWRDGATVTVPRRLWRDMAVAGWSKAAAEGRLVRVRGIIENSGTGPVLALSSGAAIEALD